MRNCRRQGRFVFLPVEELLLSRIFRIVVEYRGMWVDCPSVHLRQVCFFPLFRSFFDKTSLRAKVNRTDTRPVTRNFPGKERPDHNGGNRVGIFSTSFPSPSPKRILLIKEETLRHRSTFPEARSRCYRVAASARKVSRRVARYFAARSWRETTDSFVS